MTTCPSCGKENEPHYKFCLGCGGELPPGPPARSMPTPTTQGWLDELGELAKPTATKVDVAPALREAQAASAPASARACPNCGNVVPVSFTFCGQCGARMAGHIETLRSVATHEVTNGNLVLVRADGSEGGTHSIKLGENVIGRGRGPLFDGDGYLSPRHAVLELAVDGATLTDTGSLNGIFLRLTEEEEIVDGDVVRVGQELLRFDVLPPAEPLPDGTHIMGSPHAGAWGRLVLIVSRDQDGSAFRLGGESVIIGRERGDILFPEDGYVSGTHARVTQRNGRFYFADLNSSNGSFIKLRGPRAIPAGSLVLMGQQLFRVAY